MEVTWRGEEADGEWPRTEEKERCNETSKSYVKYQTFAEQDVIGQVWECLERWIVRKNKQNECKETRAIHVDDENETSNDDLWVCTTD